MLIIIYLHRTAHHGTAIRFTIHSPHTRPCTGRKKLILFNRTEESYMKLTKPIDWPWEGNQISLKLNIFFIFLLTVHCLWAFLPPVCTIPRQRCYTIRQIGPNDNILASLLKYTVNLHIQYTSTVPILLDSISRSILNSSNAVHNTKKAFFKIFFRN